MPREAADDSIIDVTGVFFRLKQALEKEIADIQAAASSVPPANHIYTFHDYEPPSLGQLYRDKLALTPRQISWLNRFPLPANTFLDIEAGRAATVRLYVAVLPLLELQLKGEGSTLAQTVKTLDSRAKSLRYYASTTWYYTPPKTGADAYLAIFRLCENAVRVQFAYKRKMAGLFSGALAELEPVFQELLGKRVRELLPGLLALIPPLDHDTELLLNEQNTSRWKAELEQLANRLPTTTPAFAAALAELARRNARNPAVGALYQEATKRLAATNREEALRYHLRYLHFMKARFAEGKALPKSLHKQLLPLPGQAERFQIIVNELDFYKKLEDALAKVPGVYIEPRKKIELDSHAIQAARSQHAGTVALLNEYLQDEPTPAKAPAKPKKSASKAAPKAPTLPPVAPKAASVSGATGSTFAPGLTLAATQQALLHLFAAHQLALSRAAIEAFAQQHGTLRNQLIDSLNEACYELLDDVLIEESDEGHTIYEPYFQKITNPIN